MTRAAYIFLLTFAAILAESVLSSFGIAMPTLAPLVFYLAVAFGPGSGAFAAIAGGAALDFVLGRETPASAALLLLVAGLAMLWLYKVESDSVLLLAAPGASLPLIAWLPHALRSGGGGEGVAGILSDASCALIACICSALILPAMVLLLDSLNQALELELYTDAKERIARAQ